MFERISQRIEEFRSNLGAQYCLNYLAAKPSGPSAPRCVGSLMDFRTRSGEEFGDDNAVLRLKEANESLCTALGSTHVTVRAGAACLLWGTTRRESFDLAARLFVSEQDPVVLHAYANLLSYGIASGYNNVCETLQWVTREPLALDASRAEMTRYGLASTLQLEARYGSVIMGDYAEYLREEKCPSTFGTFIAFLKRQHDSNIRYLHEAPEIVRLLKSLEHFGSGPAEEELRTLAGQIRQDLGEEPFECKLRRSA